MFVFSTQYLARRSGSCTLKVSAVFLGPNKALVLVSQLFSPNPVFLSFLMHPFCHIHTTFRGHLLSRSVFL